TFVPLSIIRLPAASLRKSTAGRLPSACLGPVAPVSDVLAKSLAAGVMFRSQVLNMVSTPPMLEFLFGNPMLFRMMWASAPDSVIVVLGSPAGLASMLYWVPFMYDVLLYQVLPPVEWLA